MKFFVDQHGCAKNQVDGEEIVARLEDLGHTCVSDGREADLVIVNTCGFIEPAKKESIEAVIAIKAAWPEKKVLVAGCLAQRYPDTLLGEMPEADGIFGNADLSGIGTAAENAMAGKRTAIAPAQPWTIPAGHVERHRLFDYPGTAHVKITEGCSNHCTYCAIPNIRGELRSRPAGDILDEIRFLTGRGIHEIVLIGQDLAAYGADMRAAGQDMSLPALLGMISGLEGDFRIRALYIHPDHFPPEILGVMLKDKRILPYFDLPMQHASASVLKAMNRTGSPEKYLSLISSIRQTLPESMIRTTFLLGFPGETGEDFAVLRDFQEKAQLDWMGAFAYSREEDTPAWAMKGRVPAKVAERRKTEVEKAQEPITEKRLERFVGTIQEVLVEEKVEGENLSLGRAWMQAPDVDGLVVVNASLEPGTRVTARVVAVHGVDLEAEALDTTA